LINFRLPDDGTTRFKDIPYAASPVGDCARIQRNRPKVGRDPIRHALPA
jgi:carboxylesterase type B